MALFKNPIFNLLLIVSFFAIFCTNRGSLHAEYDDRTKGLFASWQNVGEDYLGLIWEIYPSGIMVRRNPKDAKDTKIFQWKVTNGNQLVIFDLPSPQKYWFEEKSNKKRRPPTQYTFRLTGDSKMTWSFSWETMGEIVFEYRKIGELPKGMENLHLFLENEKD